MLKKYLFYIILVSIALIDGLLSVIFNYEIRLWHYLAALPLAYLIFEVVSMTIGDLYINNLQVNNNSITAYIQIGYNKGKAILLGEIENENDNTYLLSKANLQPKFNEHKKVLCKTIKNGDPTRIKIFLEDEIFMINFTRIKDTDEKITTYETVKIGNKEWMIKNLNVNHFRNGDQIPEAKSNKEWIKAGENQRPAWCYYGNNPANSKKYGKLYNWYAVSDLRGLAPEGWHIPSDQDWEKFIKLLGGKDVAGSKLKASGTTNWKSPNNPATNEADFTALPGGNRVYNGIFNYLGGNGYWWSCTASSSTLAWNRRMNYNSGYVYRNHYDKGNGFSVRCIRD